MRPFLRRWRRRLASTLTFQPIDVTTPEARARERHRRVALTTLVTGGARAISVLTILVSVPLAVGYLGTERYGVWMTISSMIALLAFADLGLGNGLVNAVADAHGNDDIDAAREYVSSAFFMLLALSVALGVCFAAAYGVVPWPAIFKVSSPEAVAEAGPAMAVFMLCFLASMPLGVVERVQLGYQEGYVNGLWTAFGSVLGLGGVLLGISQEAGLPWLVLAMAGGPVVATALNGVVLFARRRPWLLPTWRRLRAKAARRILELGALFFLLQLAVALAFASDNIVVARLFGPSAVTEYSVSMRMFSVLPVMLVILFNPLWPAYGEAIARGDIPWVRSTLARSLAIASAPTAAVSVILVVFGVDIVHAWAGEEITPSFALLVGLGVWTVLNATGSAVAMFLNGANVIRLQVVSALLMAVSALGAKIALGSWVGLPGVIWGTIIAYSVFTAIPVALYVPRLLSRLQARATPTPTSA